APVQPNFEEIFGTHHRIIYRYACALTRDGALAEDIVQEVFIRLYKNPDAARNEELLRAWLLRVTANVAQNMLRGRRRGAARDEKFVILAAQMAENPQPDEALLREAEISGARQALDQIREPIRSCLLLKHEGLSYREIAEALGIKEASVGSMIARGRREFIRLYEKIAREYRVNPCFRDDILCAYLDGAIAPKETIVVSEHMAECATCAVRLRELGQIVKLMGAALDAELSKDAPTGRLRARFKAFLNEASAPFSPAKTVSPSLSNF